MQLFRNGPVNIVYVSVSEGLSYLPPDGYDKADDDIIIFAYSAQTVSPFISIVTGICILKLQLK